MSLLLVVVQYKLPWLPECFHPYGEIPSRKGKYPMLRTNTKPHQLIKHAKISYSIVSLVFSKFSYRTYRNGLNRVPQSWGTPSISKVTKRVSSIPFIGNPLSQGAVPQKCIYVSKDRSSFSGVSLKSETKDSRP